MYLNFFESVITNGSKSTLLCLLTAVILPIKDDCSALTGQGLVIDKHKKIKKQKIVWPNSLNNDTDEFVHLSDALGRFHCLLTACYFKKNLHDKLEIFSQA